MVAAAKRAKESKKKACRSALLEGISLRVRSSSSERLRSGQISSRNSPSRAEPSQGFGELNKSLGCSLQPARAAAAAAAACSGWPKSIQLKPGLGGASRNKCARARSEIEIQIRQLFPIDGTIFREPLLVLGRRLPRRAGLAGCCLSRAHKADKSSQTSLPADRRGGGGPNLIRLPSLARSGRCRCRCRYKFAEE